MIYIVGVGPGSKEYLTYKATTIVNSGDLIVGSKRLLNMFDNNENKEKLILTVNLRNELNNLFNNENSKYYYKNYKNIVILSSGDPCFSGLLKTVLKYTDKNNIEVISGISSIQIACAKLKISWEDYIILTIHGKEENKEKLLNLVKNNEKIIFLPNNVKKDLEYLINNGIDGNKKIWICENLTYNSEKIIYDSINNILNNIKNNNYKISYCVVCVIN